MAPLRWAYPRGPKFKNRNLKIFGKFKKTQIKNNSLHKQTYHMEAWEEFKQQALLHHWRQQNLAAQLALQQRQQKHMQMPRNLDVDDPEEDPEEEHDC